MKKTILSFLLLLASLLGFSQIYDPVDWSYSVEQNGNEATLIFSATIEEGWHVYSQTLESDDGPEPTQIWFTPNENYELIGKTTQSKTYNEYDPNFDMNLSYFKDKAVFKQKIRIKTDKKFTVLDTIRFMVCNESMCLPPEELANSFELNNNSTQNVIEKTMDLVGNPTETLSIGGISGAEGEAEEETHEGESDGLLEPVKWVISSEKVGENLYEISVKMKIIEHWHVFSSIQDRDDGPIVTELNVFDSTEFEYVGGIEEVGNKISIYDSTFEMTVHYYENEVEFKRKIKVTDPSQPIQGELYGQTCRTSCILINPLFKIDLNTGKMISEEKESLGDNSYATSILPDMSNFDLDNPINDCGGESSNSKEKKGLWLLFLMGIGGGLIALITPCVYPMIPLTVSFFTKGGQDSKGGLGKAALYGFFIFLIYVSLSLPFWFTNADPEILNGIATSPILNLIFFAVFVFFAFSFLGYYELTLPAKWSNKVDSASNMGGIIGIALMALTLALVSFSCTGPIIGSVLAGVLSDGPLPLTVALAGFGIALGLPFALFAAFPSIMKKMPQSGGWLNAVKVVLGFLELALALKFLSNADLVSQWGLIKRELFFGLWILIGLGLVAYLFGLIKFPHDHGKPKLSFFRVSFAIMVLAFVIYLIPGLTCGENSNRRLVSGFPPPMHYSYCNDGDESHENSEEESNDHIKFYKDYEEAVEIAKAQDKPVLIDFTGWACVNCREVEENIWTDSAVESLIKNEFILASLYVDDRTLLPKEKQGEVDIKTSKGKIKTKVVKTIGDKWIIFETLVFKNIAQPRYVLVSPDGTLLNNPISYSDIKKGGGAEFYADFLRCGIEAYNKIK